MIQSKLKRHKYVESGYTNHKTKKFECFWCHEDKVIMHVNDMIIIGGGPAGYTAALYAARAGLDTLVLERMIAGGQMTLTGDIENYPGYDAGIDGFTLGEKMRIGAERFGTVTGYEEVLQVDFSNNIKTVKTVSNVYQSKTVVIATGANPRKLGLESEDDLIGKGVHYCAHCDGRFYKDKTVVVVGGGNSAVADALYLSRLAERVYLIHRRDKLRATKIYHDPLMQSENIKIIWNSTVEELIRNDRVKGVKVKNKTDGGIREIACDGVFVSIGRIPATDFLKQEVRIDDKGYVVADESTRTSVDGVYAIGDVRTKSVRQIVTAVSDGAVAAYFAEEYLSEFN